MKKAKILWISDFTNPTGLGNVSRYLIKNLTHAFDIDIMEPQLFFYEGETTDAQTGTRVLGTADIGDQGAFRKLQQFDFGNYDAVFLLNDVWAINMYAHVLKMRNIQIPVVAYFPVDAEDHNPDWYINFDKIDRPITYTQFAKSVILKAAPQVAERLTIMPHGVDTSVFYPMPNKADIRREIYGSGFMKDHESAFVVFNGNRNQPRKKLDITLRAFARFAEGKENVWLHMHCGITDQAMDLLQLAERYKIQDKIIFTDLKSGAMSVPQDHLNKIYNAADVGVNTSMGEGWGLVSVEHACTGVAQIVPRHSACIELFENCGAIVNAPQPWTMDNVMTTGHIIDEQQLVDMLTFLYDNPDERNIIADKQLYEFTKPKYSWKVISDGLKLVFLDLLAH